MTMTDYVRSDFTAQFHRLEDILDRDDAGALQLFLREERFILLVDEQQMQLLNDTTKNASLIEQENVLPVLVSNVFEPEVSPREMLLVKFLGNDPTRNPSVFIQKEVFAMRAVYDRSSRSMLHEEMTLAKVGLYGSILHLREWAHRFQSGWNCLTYLTESPQSWNVDLIDFYELAALQLADFHDDFRGAVQLASFSNEVRPYPIAFEISHKYKAIDVPLSYLLWPQSARFIQPQRMQPQVDEINRTASLHIPTGPVDPSEENEYRPYIHIGLIYELLLANSELVNFDMTGDERLPCDDLSTMNSTCMWPIRPACGDDIVDHSKCKSFLACIEPEWSWKEFEEKNSYRQRIYNTWKVHRFVNASLGSGSTSKGPFQWGPLSLKDYARLVIRRFMVRRVGEFLALWSLF